MILVFTLYALFASAFTVLKGALEYASPFFIVGSRMTLAGILMIGYAALRYPTALALHHASFIRILLLGFFNIFLTNILEVWGLQYLTSFKTCFLYSLTPFLTALLSYFLLQEVLTKRKWLGLIIGFVGFWPIIAQQSHTELSAGALWAFSLPELAVFCAVLSSVFGWILLQQLVHADQCPPVVANGYSMLFGGILATCLSLLCEPWNPIPVSNYPIWIETSLFLIIVSNIMAYNLYGYLLKRFSPTFLAFAGLSTNLFTALFGWLFHGEIIGPPFFISLTIVFLGLFIFYFEEISSRGREKAAPEEKRVEEPPRLIIPREPSVPT